VREPNAGPPVDEYTIFIQSSRPVDNAALPLQINGTTMPDTIVLRTGHVARCRVMNLAALYHNTIIVGVVLTGAQSAAGPVGATDEQWRVLAKDGFPLLATAQVPRPARQGVAMGETYDFVYTPAGPGALRLEVFAPDPPRKTLVTIPVRVE
jgi:FtsP/CotA-like multicopper oxidase with cupredoxin domain